LNDLFLPVSRDDMLSRGWYYYDFLLITGDAYVDHPSFGTPVIGRVLEAEGYRVAILPQPNVKDLEAIRDMGRPRYAAMISSGNLDSMVAHYTAAKRRRSEDFYSPGKKAGLRPDRAVTVYSQKVKEAFPGLPVIIGGLEASLRRFAHYDYWKDSVLPSVLLDAGANMLVYGMGERASREIAKRLKAGLKIEDIKDIRGTAYISLSQDCSYEYVLCPSYDKVKSDKASFAKACKLQYDEHDPVRGRAVIQQHGDRYLIVNPPAYPLNTKELDFVAQLPFTREAHPMYDNKGGVPALEEVQFSVIHNRGCFGGCNFCSLAFHQGRMVTSRSHASVIKEVEGFVKHPQFKGYVHDVGGPTANFRHVSCKKQLKAGLCADRNCLSPAACPNLDADHKDYLTLLRKLREIEGVKKVFIRSGIRFDYLMADKNGEFFADLVKHHISGQLKVAPEHCVNTVLDFMGKPHNEIYERFTEKYKRLNKEYGKNQFLVPYLMSSHPGSRLEDAVRLAEYLKKNNIHPEQVQDFYPTPGTLSTCMYYTGIDPRTGKSVYVPRDYHEKELQRALLQWYRPDKKRLVIEALKKAGREDLIGYSKHCLVRPESTQRKPKKTKKTPPH
jgi:uncharacterized radical SAM protein YgiQ